MIFILRTKDTITQLRVWSCRLIIIWLQVPFSYGMAQPANYAGSAITVDTVNTTSLILANKNDTISQLITEGSLEPNRDILAAGTSVNNPQEQSEIASISKYARAIANIRLKKYALGLKTFYEFLSTDSIRKARLFINLLANKSPYIDSLVAVDLSTGLKSSKTQASKAISVRKILRSFKDGKKAIAYGILIHIKQPVPGTRRTFKWFDGVGHSFITLTKYNIDSSIVSSTYGYYPNRKFLLQGTPVLPAATSIYKNDAFHDADETLGKLISARQFHRILRITKRFAARKYHLNKNNCTDFVLKVATVAGFQINQTNGNWPLGGGNDPGDTGQSILENKIKCDCGNNFLIYTAPKSRVKDLSSATDQPVK